MDSKGVAVALSAAAFAALVVCTWRERVAASRKQGSLLFAFGVITDIQYADREDGTNFLQTVRRRYRNALNITKDAVRDWNKHAHEGGLPGWGPRTDISFIAQLGDVIDGCNKDLGASESALNTVLTLLQKAPTPHFVHCIGNHELYNFKREQLYQVLASNPPGAELAAHSKAYFSFQPHPKFTMIVLDPYDISTLAPANDNPEPAYRMLSENNPNDVRTGKDFTAGLQGIQKRWVPYNGAIGDQQLSWLEATVCAAQKSRQRVVILTHVGVCPGSTEDSTLIWNYDKVLEVCHKYTCVVAVMCGHDHTGGYALDAHGVHHITFESPLECEVGEMAYGLVVVREHGLRLCGAGKTKTRDLLYRSY